jgi:DNA-binding transcriptional MerR regulator
MPSQRTGTTTSLILFEPDTPSVYTIEDAARVTGIPRRTIVLYSRAGVVSPTSDPKTEGWTFNGAALRTLRRAEPLRTTCGANFFGIKLMLDLMDEVESLRARILLGR